MPSISLGDEAGTPKTHHGVRTLGPEAVVSPDDAREAIETADRFVACLEGLLSGP